MEGKDLESVNPESDGKAENVHQTEQRIESEVKSAAKEATKDKNKNKGQHFAEGFLILHLHIKFEPIFTSASEQKKINSTSVPYILSK